MGRLNLLRHGLLAVAFVLGAAAGSGHAIAATESGTAAELATEPADKAAGKDQEPKQDGTAGSEADPDSRIARQGLVIDFSVKPVLGSFEEEREVYERDYANLSFTIKDAASGEPVQGLIPGAWVDLAQSASGAGQGLNCKDRVGLYIRGSTGNRPLIDVNSYFILVLNEDATISVVDPNVLIAGIGNMFYTQVILPRPGADWAQTRDQTRLFVSMPRAGTLGVIDTETFKLLKQVKTGKEPVRVAIQPDQRYVWVGNNAKGKPSGVTVVDAQTYEVAAEIETGSGHHEIAFTDDSRFAFVTNRTSGTASVIDVQTLRKVKDIEVGKTPMSLGYSALSQSFYVADGDSGRVSVVADDSFEVVRRIALKSGLGPMRVSQDGRWIFVTNASQDVVHVVDTATNALAHDVPVQGRPYQVSVTRAFAYVRALDSERVSMINLAELGKGRKPPVVMFPVGDKPPSASRSLSIADGIVEAAGEAGVIAVDPAGNTMAYYMEGMNAPMGSFKSYGHNPRAIMVTDRSLEEREPGIYSARIQVPAAGTFETAFVIDSPPVLHCFRFTVLENPLLKKDLKPVAVDYLVEDRKVTAGETVNLRFRLTNPAADGPHAGLQDVRVLYFRAPGLDRTEVAAKEVGDGLYEAALPIRKPGAYYVYVSSLSAKAGYGDLPYLTLRGVRAHDSAREPAKTE